jgi:precorrin-6B methylase 2
MPDAILQVDYDRLWLEQMKGFDHGSGVAEYWDRRSRTFYCNCQSSTYAEKLMSLMELQPQYSVLDVGCGCGAMAIPLASKVNRVTALDISNTRLQKLLKKATATGLTNITTINRDWNEVAVGKDIDRHDIVLLSRSVPARLSEALSKIALAAKSAGYITWRAERTDEFETELAKAMGKNLPFYPDCSAIYGMLRKMNIPARMDMFETSDQEKYSTLHEAALSMARGAEVTELQLVKLLRIARNYLTKMDDYYSFTRQIKWVLISWEN